MWADLEEMVDSVVLIVDIWKMTLHVICWLSKVVTMMINQIRWWYYTGRLEYLRGSSKQVSTVPWSLVDHTVHCVLV